MKEPITKNGFDLLKKNLDELKNVVRPKVVESIKIAREFGDLKENAEYHAAKEELYLLDKKIRTVENKILNSEIINVNNNADSRIFFGATVTLLNMKSNFVNTYRLVGDGEANINNNDISVKSPLAQKILLKEKDDQVSIEVNGNIVEYKILDVRYI